METSTAGESSRREINRGNITRRAVRLLSEADVFMRTDDYDKFRLWGGGRGGAVRETRRNEIKVKTDRTQ